MRNTSLVVATLFSVLLAGCIPETEPNNTVAEATANNLRLYDTLASDRLFGGVVEGTFSGVDRWFLWTVRSPNTIRLFVSTEPNAYVTVDAFACLEPAVQHWDDCPQAKRLQFANNFTWGGPAWRENTLGSVQLNQANHLIQVVVRWASPSKPNPFYYFRLDPP